MNTQFISDPAELSKLPVKVPCIEGGAPCEHLLQVLPNTASKAVAIVHYYEPDKPEVEVNCGFCKGSVRPCHGCPKNFRDNMAEQMDAA